MMRFDGLAKRREAALCRDECAYRALYEGAQASLTDMASKQSASLGQHGRLRAGVIAALRNSFPRQFADLEERIGCRLTNVGDEALLAYVAFILEEATTAGMIPVAREHDTQTLAEALATVGITVPPGDDLVAWAGHITADNRRRLASRGLNLTDAISRVVGPDGTPNLGPGFGSGADVAVPTPNRAAPRPALVPAERPRTLAEAIALRKRLDAEARAAEAAAAAPSHRAPIADPTAGWPDVAPILPAIDPTSPAPAPATPGTSSPLPASTVGEGNDLESMFDDADVDAPPPTDSALPEVPPAGTVEGDDDLIEDPFAEPDDPFAEPDDPFAEPDDPFAGGFDDMATLDEVPELDDMPSLDAELGDFDGPTAPAVTEPAGPARDAVTSEPDDVPDPSALLDSLAAGAGSEPVPETGDSPAPAVPPAGPDLTAAPAKAPKVVNTNVVRPELFPNTPKVARGRARKPIRTSAQVPDAAAFDVVPEEIVSRGELTDELRNQLMALACIPRPVFTSDLIAVVGERVVDAWQEECRSDNKAPIRFVNPKPRHRARGSLVLPYGELRKATTDFRKSWWATCLDPDTGYRGAKLYELAVLMSRVGDQAATNTFGAADCHDVVVLHLNQPRGLVGVLVVLGDDFDNDGATRKAMVARMSELLGGRLALLAVLTTTADKLQTVIDVIDTEAATHNWSPTCPVVAAHTWEYANNNQSTFIQILG